MIDTTGPNPTLTDHKQHVSKSKSFILPGNNFISLATFLSCDFLTLNLTLAHNSDHKPNPNPNLTLNLNLTPNPEP